MPQSPDRKREYMAELMRKRREGSRQNPEIEEAAAVLDEVRRSPNRAVFKPFRAPNGNFIVEPPTVPYDRAHIHLYSRKLGEDTAKCGICGEVVRYEGKPLNIYNDGLPDWPQLIRDSPVADQVQRKMPVTQKRDQR